MTWAQPEDDVPQERQACFAWPPSDPRDGEGLLGWLLRESSEQHVPSIGVILAQATSRVNLRAEQRVGARLDAEALASVTITDPAVIRGLMYPPLEDDRVSFWGAAIPSWHVESRKRRFSRATLAETGVALAAWEHKFLPFCPRNWDFLTDRCPDAGCGAQQTWHWAVGTDCCPRCGGRLSSRRRRKVPGAWRSRLSVVALLTSGHRPPELGTSIPPQLHDADPGDVLEFIHALFPICGERPLTMTTSIWWQRHPVRLAATLADAVGLLEDWPRMILDRLATTGGRRAVSCNGANDFLQGRGVRPGGPPSRLVADLAANLLAHGPGRAPGSDAAYSIVTTSSMLGRGTAIIAEARRTGLLRTSVMLRNGSIVLGLDRRDVDDLVDRIKHRTSLWRVARYLGIPRYAVEDLAGAGDLLASTHAYMKDRYGLNVLDSRNVQEFLHSIEAGSTTSRTATRPLKSWMHAVGARLKPWAAVLGGIARGEITACVESGHLPLVERIRIAIDAIDPRDLGGATPVVEAVVSERQLTRGDAIEILNLNHKHYASLTAALGDRATVPATEVLALASQLISSSEIQARWHLDGRTASALIGRHAPEAERSALGFTRKPVEALFSKMPQILS